MLYQGLQFLPIPGHDGYFASKCGQIASLKRNRFAVRRLDPKRGYWRISLCQSGKTRKYFVHRLIALTFVGPRPSKIHEINHKNGDTRDNRAENLEWVTPIENIRHSEIVLGKYYPGEKSHKSKLTTKLVIELKKKHAGGQSFRSLAREIGVDKSTISRAVKGETWANI